MSKAVLISIHPEWCELIANGKKTMEVRKTRPKLDTPFKCYIYCTAGNLSYPVKNGMVCHNNGGKVVIGEFVCDSIRCFDVPYPAFQKKMDESIMEQSCLTYWQLHRYAYHDALYGWHISDLVIYDRPKELRELKGLRQTKFGWALVPIFRPPQSWHYVEELTEGGTDNA